MNQENPERSPSLAGFAKGRGGKAARELISAIKEDWLRGQPADAQAVLSQYPELATQKSTVLDLAYEEYCLRQEAGAPPDPDEFCERFPNFKTSLRRLIVAHQCVENLSPRIEEPPPVRWPEPGDSFVGFSLIRELGRGAFARVFLAYEPKLGNRLVAVKVSQEGAAEAETLGRLAHANVVPVYSVQKEELTGLTVVCMPYLGSATLCDVLDRAFADSGPPRRAGIILEAIQDALPLGESVADRPRPHPLLQRGTYVDGILHIAVQLAEALSFVHAMGICHRDLKPSNVLMTPDGRPMLLDFNLSFDQRRTNQRLGGTLPYMAPEHLRVTVEECGATTALLDVPADLFSLGVILYELLTGAHPFGPIPLNSSAQELRIRLLERQQQGPKPLRRANPQVGKSLAQIIEQCLAHNSNERPRSAAELATALRKSVSWRVRAHYWVARHHVAVLGAVLVAVTAGGFAGAFFWHVNRPETQYQRGRQAYGAGQFDQAVQYFNHVLEVNSDNPQVLFARGRAHQQQGNIKAAIADYEKADELQADGQIKACIGYYWNQQLKHGAAALLYEEAIQAGFATAEVYNNLGYSYLESYQRLDKARKSLEKAIRLSPTLQAASYNRALVDLIQAQRDPAYNPEAGLSYIQKAIQLGPESAELFYNAALLYALAAKHDESQIEPALNCLQKAIAQGKDPRILQTDKYFQSLRQIPRFQALVKTLPFQVPERGVPRIVDPFQSFPN
jgi:tetratricopeptide (TPR) repeat protein